MTATPEEPAGSRPPKRRHGALEDEVMAALRAAHRPLPPAEVHAAVGTDRLAYTTVTTILHRLYRKGLAVRRRHGRGYAYAPARLDADRTARAMHALLPRGPDRTTVLARFVSELSPEDERFLQHMLHDPESDDPTR